MIRRVSCWLAASAVALSSLLATLPVSAADNVPPEGFTALFNGKDFSGWYGLGTEDPRKVQALSPEDLKAKREKDTADMLAHWKIENGELVNDGKGAYMTSAKDYGDFELIVEWKRIPKGDSGVYLKGTPQVQIWDTTEAAGYWNLGANKGSGGLWNNRAGTPGKDPVVLADKPIGEWNKFHIIQVGSRTTVLLNDKLVVDHAILENYFDKDKKTPLVPKGPIQLQTHGNEVRWKNIYVREIPADEAGKILASKGDAGFVSLFNGTSLEGWKGAVDNYEVVDGAIVCKAGKGGVLHTPNEYTDFAVRLEFAVPEGGNNGLAIRYPGTGDPAFAGFCELQVLDNSAEKYAKLDPRQYHGSVYGKIPGARGYQRPVGEWNFQEVTVKGTKITVELNGSLIVDGDTADVKEFMNGEDKYPGRNTTKGFFGFAGHGDAVKFRNVRIKPLSP